MIAGGNRIPTSAPTAAPVHALGRLLALVDVDLIVVVLADDRRVVGADEIEVVCFEQRFVIGFRVFARTVQRLIDEDWSIAHASPFVGYFPPSAAGARRRV